MATEKRLIDANEMKNNIMEAMMRQFEKNGDQIALRIAEMMWHFIDVTDTVDAVEVVRCKDCKHWKHIEHVGCSDLAKVCVLAGYMIGANGYCLYGERKDNG